MAEKDEPAGVRPRLSARSLSFAVLPGIGIFFTALGLMFMFENFLRYSTLVLPFSPVILAIIFAVSFAATTALFELRGTGHIHSLTNGIMLGVTTTVLILLITSGVLFIMGVGGPYIFSPALWELLIAAVACIAGGIIVMRLLPR